MPKLSIAGDTRPLGRRPMVPRRTRPERYNRLGWCGAISVALHVTILALVIITFPNKTPPEPPPPTGVDVVFETGEKTPKAAATKGSNEQAREAAPRGRPSPKPQRSVQAAPPPAPLPRPEIKPVEPPHPVPPPRPQPTPKPPPPKPTPVPAPPLVPKPVPKPAAPKPPVPKPVTPPPPPPPLPKINLPPPPPPAPKAPQAPTPPPVPVPLPSAITENEPAEVNLNMPQLPELAPMNLPPPPPLPPLPPPPQQAAPARRSGHGRSTAFSQGVMMNGMSFGGGSVTGGRTQGLNLNLPSSMQPQAGSDVTVKGDPGRNWMAELQQWVNDRADYPELAGEMGQQGSVTIRFTVDRAGNVSGLTMITPTGYALLDQDWLGLFRGAHLPPLDDDAKSNSVTVTATMHYQIVH